MKLENVVIEGIHHLEPPEFISSEQIETELSPVYQRLKLPFGRLEMLTGITNRGLWPLSARPSDMASEAAQGLIEKYQLERNDYQLLIHASVCRDFLEPATASVVHHHLKLPSNCRLFDLSNACLGVMSAIEQAAVMIESGMIKKALIVSGENSRALLNETLHFLNIETSLTRKTIKKYIANLTIGSGAVAISVSSKKDAQNTVFDIEYIKSMSDSSHHQLCQGDGHSQDSLMMTTESEELLHAGISLAKNNFDALLTEMKATPEDFHKVICHQVGKAHRDLLLRSLELSADKEFGTFQHYGNTGTVAIIQALSLAYQQKFILPDDMIALLGIGSGLVSSMMSLKACSC